MTILPVKYLTYLFVSYPVILCFTEDHDVLQLMSLKLQLHLENCNWATPETVNGLTLKIFHLLFHWNEVQCTMTLFFCYQTVNYHDSVEWFPIAFSKAGCLPPWLKCSVSDGEVDSCLSQKHQHELNANNFSQNLILHHVFHFLCQYP